MNKIAKNHQRKVTKDWSLSLCKVGSEILVFLTSLTSPYLFAVQTHLARGEHEQ